MIFVNNQYYTSKYFNDGSYYIVFNNKELPNPTTITWLFEDNEEMFALMSLTRHIQETCPNVILHMPYVPNARQDRAPSSYDVFTLKYFAEFINNLHFTQVKIFDPHSDVTAALLDRVQVISPRECIQQVLDKIPDALIMYPDSGSAKKYGSLFKTPYLRGIKVRNFETQKIEAFQLVGTGTDVRDRNILIVDDIGGTGHTLFQAARELKNLGAAHVYVYVSHCENTILGPHINGQSLLDIRELITKLYTTNSIFHGAHPKIEIIKDFTQP